MACPQEGFPTYLWPEVVRKAVARARDHDSGQSQGKGDEGREGGRATGKHQKILLICVKYHDLITEIAQGPGHQGKASQEGGEGEIRKDGREDAQEASRATKAQGEAQQADQLLNEMMRSLELG